MRFSSILLVYQRLSQDDHPGHLFHGAIRQSRLQTSLPGESDDVSPSLMALWIKKSPWNPNLIVSWFFFWIVGWFLVVNWITWIVSWFNFFVAHLIRHLGFLGWPWWSFPGLRSFDPWCAKGQICTLGCAGACSHLSYLRSVTNTAEQSRNYSITILYILIINIWCYHVSN